MIWVHPRPLVESMGEHIPEPVFVNLIKSPEIDSRSGGPVQQPYLTYRPAGLHRLAESLPRNRFLGSINVYKYGLCCKEVERLRERGRGGIVAISAVGEGEEGGPGLTQIRRQQTTVGLLSYIPFSRHYFLCWIFCYRTTRSSAIHRSSDTAIYSLCLYIRMSFSTVK
jgi:hypothetical protein